ncbi:MAG: gliding motility-associated C-terminal domain-containing protein [Cyclobacteriaceae bacterium]|nr:gliding motility-associated C-terminal domain-containing protein [Cyclobacteriaceae bacterium]
MKSQNLSTEGDDFWIGFMDNWLQDPANPIILEIYISADDTTRAHIEMPHYLNDFIPVDTLIYPDRTIRIVIPTQLGMSTGTSQVQNRGIHIKTDKDVSVYAMNKRQYSADMAVILPTYTLANDYVVISHWEDGNRNNNDNSDSEFLLVAVEDDTKIEIIPSHLTEGGDPAHVPFSVTLNQGQTYQVQARGDLTGTLIRSAANTDSECKKFAVFAGNQYTKVGECDNPNGHDHLYAQMYPVYTWGKEYITVDFNTRYQGDHVKVIAAEDNSGILLNGQPVRTLDRGEFLFLKELEGVNYISSDKPISVAQFSRSQACDGTVGDPFIILINPNEQVLKKITFYAPTVATIQNYNLSIVTRTSDVPTVRLDGADISGMFTSVPFNPEYSYAKVSVFSGNHTLQSTEGLIAYVYGYGNNESFGYPTGAGLTNLNLNFQVVDEQGEDLPFDHVCYHTEVWFRPETEYEFTGFHWDFGDGTTFSTTSPDSVSHVYEKPGKYIVELKGTTGSSNCITGAEQTSIKVVYVINPRSQILGPRSVCPFTQSVPYYIPENATYVNSWFVGGGIISHPGNDTILIDWAGTKRDALIKVLSTDKWGCIGDTVFKNVKIKIQLEPEAPAGPDSLCADNISDIEYQTYYTPGMTYRWFTDFGQIGEGQGTEKIFMDWESFGYGNLWYEQESVTDTVCKGISDTLGVYIQRKPSEDVRILIDKFNFGINEAIRVELEADTLYQIVTWMYQGQQSIDSVSIDEQPERYYQCPGLYFIRAIAMDTAGLCITSAEHSIEIQVEGPLVEIIQVTHENNLANQLYINWKYDENQDYTKPYYLSRDGKLLDSLFRNRPVFPDTSVVTDDQPHEYRVSTNHDCPLEIQSDPHTSIWLSLPEDKKTEDEVALDWSDYEGWSEGVNNYEIWMSVDSSPYSLISENGNSGFTFSSDDLGFEHCYKIRALELNGNEAYSWSNITCVTFIPELYPYNIITPNGDGRNDAFIIENIEHYPHARLTIFNRWGKRILETTGYQNNWGGLASGELLPNSTYFYMLELNEPRAEKPYLNGTVSVLK